MLNANVARPYAQALFNLAKSEKRETSWLELLQKLDQIVSNEDFSSVLKNPNIEPKELILLIKNVLKDAYSKEVANLLEILTENNRLIVISEIHSIFRELVLDDQKRATAILETAYDLSSSDRVEFEKILSEKFGKQISVEVKVNPELIAGVKVTVNDKVIDSSIRGRLINLSTQLTK